MIINFKPKNDDNFYAYINSICAGSDSNYRIAKLVMVMQDYYKQNPTKGVDLEFIRTGNLYLTCLKFTGASLKDTHNMYYNLIEKYKADFPYLTQDAGFINTSSKTLYIVLKCYKKRSA